MNRREFLKQVAAWSSGAAMAMPVFHIARQALGAQPATQQPVLAVARGKDYAAIVTSAITQLGGIGQFVSSGSKVVVKPNIGWDRAPEYAANTHPQVVQAIVKLCLDAGAARVSVFDRSCNDPRRCYASSGIRAAVESLDDPRAVCPYVEDRNFVPVTIKNGKAVSEWQLYRDALEADCYINVPIAKHHSLTRLTLGLKNIMGICGGSRGKLHSQIAQKLADLHTVVRPRLTVVDATRILVRHGPQGGNLDDVEVRDTIIASTDPVAADAYATTLFGLKPEQIETTVAAYRAGLGEMDLSKIRIIEV
ncbi:DUF362 domain-containing protein [Fontivita pretiosa]|uniref:DUF362 domain-containing protein n=1 Tax=Fontivita pretiosa TaxID=2989684 RepID=UPI003D1748A2